ncbi:hypothetical protein [Marinobacter sp. CA1]|uniref:hypothetical protein n=1 Tax=Marinobacter sp. CA1 TaxID=2817656 RepID=UPI001D07B604|nr:hypothetical protein [Marinobacter sp. CA1]UDL04766.1 hypothetical protein J2887_19215 [Marinobacter sp. CA1]
MLFDDAFYLRDELNQRLVFTKVPRLDETGHPVQEAFLPSVTYAREALATIVDAVQDPFHNVMVELWLHVHGKPWAIPDTGDQLIKDIADKIGSGELFVYRER